MQGVGGVGLLFAVLGAVGFSFKAILVKLAYRHGVDAETLLALRMAFALPFFVVLGVLAGQRSTRPMEGADWLWMLGLGFFGYYLASYLDFLGLKYITAGLERLILFLVLRPLCALVQPWQVYGLALAMAVFAPVAPVWLVSEAIRHIGAGSVSLTGSLGPVITIALGWLLLDEVIGTGQVVGAAMVIGCILVMARRTP